MTQNDPRSIPDPPATNLPVGAELWNDDPRLQDVLVADLLPEVVGVTKLGDLLLDPTRRTHMECCAQALYNELVRHERQTLEAAAREIVTRADLHLHSARLPSARIRSRPCSAVTIHGLLLRYGLLGQPPATLDEVSGIIGRTRERVRQIQQRHTAAIRSTRPSWPQLDRALALALTIAPCHEDELAQELIRQGVTSTLYSAESLRACAAFAGRAFDLEIADRVVGLSTPELAAVIRATKTLANRQGLASLLQISDELVDDGVIMSEDNVRAVLRMSGRVVWLDDRHVTWPDTRRNRLANTLRTMLAVHQPVHLGTARDAISSYWTYRNAGRTADQRDLVPPSLRALDGFCSWHPDFAVVPDRGVDCVVSTVDLDLTSELGVEAAMLVELIRSTPDRATDRLTLLEAARAVGMKSSTVGVYLTFHPAFVNPVRNVWTTLGTELSLEIMDSIQHLARERSRAESRDFVTGTTDDGNCWVALAVTSSIRMSGVLLRRWLPVDIGSIRLPAFEAHGDDCGTIVYNANSGFTHGLGTYLRRVDVAVGEYLLLTVDLDWETAKITHGGPQLLHGPVRTSVP